MKTKIIKYGDLYYIQRGWIFTEYLSAGYDSYNWDYWWSFGHKYHGAFETYEDAIKKWEFYKTQSSKGIETIKILE